MFFYCICTQYMIGAPFALITASIRRGMEVISVWHCWGGMEAQVSLTVPSAHLHFLVSCFSFFSWKYSIDFFFFFCEHLQHVCWTQQSLVSRWYEMRARSSQSLLSSDWTLASKMVGRGGRKARRLSLTRTPALFPLFRRRRRRVDFATHTKGSDAVSVNSPSALKNSKSGLCCATEEPMFKSVSLS